MFLETSVLDISSWVFKNDAACNHSSIWEKGFHNIYITACIDVLSAEEGEWRKPA
jgi:hypothetical protein